MSHGRAVQQELREPSRALRREIPAVYEGYRQVHAAAFAPGALDAKVKELIALGIAVSTQCDGCIASHARGAAGAGATPAEVAEALGITIAMGGGPGTVYAARAFSAFEEFAETAGAGGPAPAAASADRSAPASPG
jgi:AhpD family alkylhydroperoxidase